MIVNGTAYKAQISHQESILRINDKYCAPGRIARALARSAVRLVPRHPPPPFGSRLPATPQARQIDDTSADISQKEKQSQLK